LFLLNAICGSGVGVIAILSPVVTAEAMLLFVALWMICVGIVQLWLACLVMPADYFGSGFMGLIGITFMITGITFIGNLEGNIGTFILFLGTCLVMFGVQLIFFGVSLLRMHRNGYSTVGAGGEIPTAATSS